MSDFQKLKDERDALRLAVQELYGWIIELDHEPAPIEEYVCHDAGVAARVALADLWPARAFAEGGPKDPLGTLVEQRVQVAWDAFEKATEARLNAMFTAGVPR